MISSRVARDQYIRPLADYYNTNFKLKNLENHARFDMQTNFYSLSRNSN